MLVPLVYNHCTKSKRKFKVYMTGNKKMGRPTDNPKDKPVHVRLDRECMDILELYQSKFNKTKAESIRDGIRKLKEDL